MRQIALASLVLCLIGGASSCSREILPDRPPAATVEPAPKFKVEVLREGLDLPSSLAFAPDGSLVVLDRGFAHDKTAYEPYVSIVDLEQRQTEVLKGSIPATSHFDDMSGNQAGAVGLALDPQFSLSRKLYVCYHHRSPQGRLENRVSSFEVGAGTLQHETVILDHLPGDPVHNGCRVAFDAQGLLYLTTGSMEPFDDALDIKRLSGKILRMTSAGGVPDGNPFPRSLVWSYGHRNPQGLAFDPVSGELWSTEHGESSADELNRIEAGANYGFPACRGSARIGETFAVEPYWSDRMTIVDGKATCQLSEPNASRYRPAFRTYLPDSTLGISDLVVYRGTAFPDWAGNLLIVTLKTQRLYRVEVRNGQFVSEEILIDGGYGRLRDIAVGPDGFIYILTNEPGPNAVWRGHSRLLRLVP